MDDGGEHTQHWRDWENRGVIVGIILKSKLQYRRASWRQNGLGGAPVLEFGLRTMRHGQNLPPDLRAQFLIAYCSLSA